MGSPSDVSLMSRPTSGKEELSLTSEKHNVDVAPAHKDKIAPVMDGTKLHPKTINGDHLSARHGKKVPGKVWSGVHNNHGHGNRGVHGAQTHKGENTIYRCRYAGWRDRPDVALRRDRGKVRAHV